MAAVLSGHKCIKGITIDDVRNCNENDEPKAKFCRYRINDEFPLNLQNDLVLDRSGIFYQDHTRSRKVFVNEGISDSQRNALILQIEKFKEDEEQLLKCDAAMNDLESCCFQLLNVMESKSQKVDLECKNQLETICTEVLTWLENCNSTSLIDYVTKKKQMIWQCERLVEIFPHVNGWEYDFRRILDTSELSSKVVSTTDGGHQWSPDSEIGPDSKDSEVRSVLNKSNTSGQKLCITLWSDAHKSDVSASQQNIGDCSISSGHSKINTTARGVTSTRITGDCGVTTAGITGGRSLTSTQNSLGDRNAFSGQQPSGYSRSRVVLGQHNANNNCANSSHGNTKHGVGVLSLSGNSGNTTTQGVSVHTKGYIPSGHNGRVPSSQNNSSAQGVCVHSSRNDFTRQSVLSHNESTAAGSNILQRSEEENFGHVKNCIKRPSNTRTNVDNGSKLFNSSHVPTSNRFSILRNINEPENQSVGKNSSHNDAKPKPTVYNKTPGLNESNNCSATQRRVALRQQRSQRRVGRNVGANGQGFDMSDKTLDSREATEHKTPGFSKCVQNFVIEKWNFLTEKLNSFFT